MKTKTIRQNKGMKRGITLLETLGVLFIGYLIYSGVMSLSKSTQDTTDINEAVYKPITYVARGLISFRATDTRGGGKFNNLTESTAQTHVKPLKYNSTDDVLYPEKYNIDINVGYHNAGSNDKAYICMDTSNMSWDQLEAETQFMNGIKSIFPNGKIDADITAEYANEAAADSATAADPVAANADGFICATDLF